MSVRVNTNLTQRQRKPRGNVCSVVMNFPHIAEYRWKIFVEEKSMALRATLFLLLKMSAAFRGRCSAQDH